MFEYNVKDIDSNYNFIINKVSTISNPKNNSIIFLKQNNCKILKNLKSIKNSLIILNNQLKGDSLTKDNLVILSENARFDYAKILTKILEKNTLKGRNYFKDGYYYKENLILGKNIIIEPFVTIGNNVEIGDNTIIKSGTKIGSNVKIGKNCYIRENSVIGGEGFGIEKDEKGNNFRVPHIGGVILKNNVEIGALTTVCSGTIDSTLIEDNVKVDDHVHIAHNVKVGKNSLVIAGSVIGGSSVISENCWIGINSSIKQKTKIGKNTILGMASRIIKDVEKDLILTNEAADTLENIKKITNYKKKLLNKYGEIDEK